VADRIERFASVVSRENVTAGTDCGFATARAGDEVHPDMAWATLKVLSEGAANREPPSWSEFITKLLMLSNWQLLCGCLEYRFFGRG